MKGVLVQLACAIPAWYRYQAPPMLLNRVWAQLACVIPSWHKYQLPPIPLNRCKRYYVSVHTDWDLLAYERIHTQVPLDFIVLPRRVQLLYGTTAYR